MRELNKPALIITKKRHFKIHLTRSDTNAMRTSLSPALNFIIVHGDRALSPRACVCINIYVYIYQHAYTAGPRMKSFCLMSFRHVDEMP